MITILLHEWRIITKPGYCGTHREHCLSCNCCKTFKLLHRPWIEHANFLKHIYFVLEFCFLFISYDFHVVRAGKHEYFCNLAHEKNTSNSGSPGVPVRGKWVHIHSGMSWNYLFRDRCITSVWWFQNWGFAKGFSCMAAPYTYLLIKSSGWLHHDGDFATVDYIKRCC